MEILIAFAWVFGSMFIVFVLLMLAIGVGRKLYRWVENQ